MSAIIALTSVNDVERAIACSDDRPVFIFKHSTRCPTSAWAYRAYTAYVDKAEPASALFTEVLVVENRPVSQDIAQRLQIPHQSPQLILLAKGHAVWNASHDDITEASIDRALSLSVSASATTVAPR